MAQCGPNIPAFTSVWPLVAEVMESHDRLTQSTRGGGDKKTGARKGREFALDLLPRVHGEELAPFASGWKGPP